MSSDKALADRVVALGVGNRKGTVFWRNPDGHTLDAPYFVRDPRVAIALMERCGLHVITIDTENAYPYVEVWPQCGPDYYYANIRDSLPRAIIKACVTALEESK